MLSPLPKKRFMAVQVITATAQRKRRVRITPSRDEALGRLDLTVLFVLPIVVSHLFHIQGQHPGRIRLDHSARHHGVTTMDRSRTVMTLQTAWTLKAGGMQIVTAVKHQGGVGALICTTRKWGGQLCGPTGTASLCK
jgi:hypothetical protein